MNFDAYIDRRRFWFILPGLQNQGMIKRFFPEKIRKTACLYGEKFNVYIDASDGIASDFGIPEYCDRILKIVEDTKGKPFLFFKNWYSPTLCQPLEKVAKENNGTIVPFMYWAEWDHFIHYLWPNRTVLRDQNFKTKKKLDIGVCAKIQKRVVPKPSKFDNRISWKGYKWFGFGDDEIDTGYYEHDARVRLHNMLQTSRFKYEQIEGVSFENYILRSMEWKCLVDMPGISCVSHRMFENGWLGQCVILKKNDVDFPYSWKEYYPEVDFNDPNWENSVLEIVENHEDWGKKILHYLETYCNPNIISKYFIENVEKYESKI